MISLIESEFTSFESIEQIHLTVYAAATAVCRILNLKFPSNQLKNTQIQNSETRIEKKT
jgi:hypothetical protein